MTDRNANASDFVQSLARGLQVLELIGQLDGTVTVSEVSERTGLNRATARRMLVTLERMGFLVQRGRNYFLTPRVMQLGYSYLSNLGIGDLVSGQLNELSQKLGEAASLTVLDGDQIFYLARAKTNKVMTIALNVGARLPAWNTSMGRVLLASLSDEQIHNLYVNSEKLISRTPNTIVLFDALMQEITSVRENAYSLVDQELELGLRSVAVAVNRQDKVVAAINVATANVAESKTDTVGRMLPELQQTAIEISKLLEASPSSSFNF